MTLLISENWRRALAALFATVVLLALGIAIGSISSSSGSTSSPTRTVTSTRTVTVPARAATPAPAAPSQVKTLRTQLVASQASVARLQRQLNNTRQRNTQLRAQLHGKQTSTTKGK